MTVVATLFQFGNITTSTATKQILTFPAPQICVPPTAGWPLLMPNLETSKKARQEAAQVLCIELTWTIESAQAILMPFKHQRMPSTFATACARQGCRNYNLHHGHRGGRRDATSAQGHDLPVYSPQRRLNSTSPADELSIMGDHVLEGKEEHRRYYHKRRNRVLARS